MKGLGLHPVVVALPSPLHLCACHRDPAAPRRRRERTFQGDTADGDADAPWLHFR